MAQETTLAAERSESALVAAALAGDRPAFGALAARHRGVLTAVCRRLLRDPHLAEDAAQEAVMLAMTGLAGLRDRSRFGPWLVGIGRNVCLAWLRERARGAPAGLGPEQEPGPHEAAETAELALAARGALARLPRGQRAAAEFFYLHDLPVVEIAGRLGIGAGAVRTRLHKARAALRRELHPYRREPEMADAPTVPMRVADVRRTAAGDEPVRHIVVLEERDGGRRLPIWVGQAEATALALALEGGELPRPGTYRFAASLLEGAGARLAEVVVSRLAEGTFYAEAVLERADGRTAVDARPSDALNLAVAVGAPVSVSAEVLESAHVQPDAWSARADEAPHRAATIAADARAEWERVAAGCGVPPPGPGR